MSSTGYVAGSCAGQTGGGVAYYKVQGRATLRTATVSATRAGVVHSCTARLRDVESMIDHSAIIRWTSNTGRMTTVDLRALRRLVAARTRGGMPRNGPTGVASPNQPKWLDVSIRIDVSAGCEPGRPTRGVPAAGRASP